MNTMIKAQTWARVWMSELARKDRGASAVEYAILVAIIVAVVIGLAVAVRAIIVNATTVVTTTLP